MKFFALIATLFLVVPGIHAQVGINTTSPSSASVLDIHSSSDNLTYGGMLPPRVTLAQRNSMSPTTADDGMIIFLTDPIARCLQVWDGQRMTWNDIYCMPYAGPAPWINEIHYENVGADVDEGIEIAGPSGLNLDEFRLVAYNGSGGTFYDVVVLSGVIDNESNGYGALWFDLENLQNGTPDGIALVQISTGEVIQFLSYEGSFNATNGDAIGMASQDIGVSEGLSSPADHSLQLSGNGNVYSDFTWNGPALHSRGDLNAGQTIN